MDSQVYTRSIIEEEEREAASTLSAEFKREGSSAERNAMADEALVAFIGAQVVLPIICGVLSSALYEIFRHITGRSLAEEARKAIEKHGPAKPPVVKGETLIEDTCQILASRDIDEKTARAIAEQLLRRIKSRLRAQNVA